MTKKFNGKAPIIYGKLSKGKKERLSWGSKAVLFSGWGEFAIDGFLVEFLKETNYSDWSKEGTENLCIIEGGQGKLVLDGKEFELRKGFAFKMYTGQKPHVLPENKLVVLSIQMPSKEAGDLEVVDPDKIPSKIYEYETLAQEIFTPKHSPGIGLLLFAFPIDRIPIHKHPFSARLIKPISGQGYCYVDPYRYEMDTDTFILFNKDTIHTNGPLPGSVSKLWAVQLPWIDSKIDEENIAGAEEFVKYIESTPPKVLWKKKEDLLRALERGSK